ncbi:MAG: hypothetical protein H8K07_22630 [Nitrospira sp.]|nr:hypothetical protein [Nitrospira sp.]
MELVYSLDSTEDPRYILAILLGKILNEIGAKSEVFDKIRLGPGVVGRSATVAVCALIVMGVIAYNLNDKASLLIIAGAAFLLFLIFFIGSMIYGSKNPSAALLEGAELVTWQKQELAAKSIPTPPSTLAIPDPKAPPPATLAIEGPDK